MNHNRPFWVMQSIPHPTLYYTLDGDQHGRDTTVLADAVVFADREQAVDYIITNDRSGYMPYCPPVVPPPQLPASEIKTPIICVKQESQAERRQLIANVAGQLHAAELIRAQIFSGSDALVRTLGDMTTICDQDGAARLSGFNPTYPIMAGIHFDEAIVEVAMKVVDAVFKLDSIVKP